MCIYICLVIASVLHKLKIYFLKISFVQTINDMLLKTWYNRGIGELYQLYQHIVPIQLGLKTVETRLDRPY